MDGFSRRLEEDIPGAKLMHGLAVPLEGDPAAFHVPGDRAGMKVRASGLAGREFHAVRLHPLGDGVQRVSKQRRSANIVHAPYSSSVTWANHSAVLPSSAASCIARWVRNSVGAAPCQCISPGSTCTVSPALTSMTSPP